MEKILNYTGHPIRILHKGTLDVKKVYHPSGTETRIRSAVRNKRKIDGVDICGAIEWRIVNEPPPPEKDTYYVVSHRCKTMMPWRDDLLIPVEQRKKNGRIWGCYRLSDMLDCELMQYELKKAA